MFTLKLYRHNPHPSNEKVTKILSVDRVIAMQIGKSRSALELHVYRDASTAYETYFVGEASEGMDAFGRDDLHLESESGSWWGWGLLENSSGKTSEHYRPASYGL